MNNAQINTAFLGTVSAQAKSQILQSIATHYGVTADEIFEEVTDQEAENLLDYMTGPERLAASVLMQKYGFR